MTKAERVAYLATRLATERAALRVVLGDRYNDYTRMAREVIEAGAKANGVEPFTVALEMSKDAELAGAGPVAVLLPLVAWADTTST